jgi:hypothetical protein
MAFFKRRKSPFAHEIDRFHAPPAGTRRFSLRKEAAAAGPPVATRRGDLTIVALGVALGLLCAMFPWYVFFNQEKFGVRAMKFEGGGIPSTGPMPVGRQPQRIGAPMNVEDIPTPQLDLFATGTLTDDKEDEDAADVPGLDEQPFPGDREAQFRLVHVANGRAMIEDEAGLWVVQAGSTLPDSSQVASIERRNGKWVLVTSTDRVVALTP